MGPPNMPQKWNNGRVECWNIGFQKDINHFKFIVNPAGGGTINPTLHHPRTHYSTIPLFHHSNCERSELSSGCPGSTLERLKEVIRAGES